MTVFRGSGYKEQFFVAASDASAKSIQRADYRCDGTADEVQIAAALAALPAAGGVVRLSEGSFVIAGTITIGRNSMLCGCGRATQIDVTGLVGSHAISLASGTNGVTLNSSIRDLRITLAASGAGDGIRTVAEQGFPIDLRNIYIDGGNVDNWGITLEGTYNPRLDHIFMDSNANGIRLTNVANGNYLYGNALLTDCHVVQHTANTYGFYLQGGATQGSINMFTLLRCEAIASGGVAGTTGFWVGARAVRGNFIQCDAENHNVGYDVGDGSTTGDIAFYDCTEFNCTTGFDRNIPSSLYCYVFGGNGDLDDYQSHVESRMKRISITADRVLGFTETSKVMNTDGAAGATTYTLTLPSADNDYLYRYTIMNTQATVSAVKIKFQVGAGDTIMTAAGASVASWTSGGALGDSLTLQNINYKYWRVEDQIGAWA